MLEREMADVEEAVGWWPVKLKLLEANYEKSKLKIRQNSLYCKLSIIQLQNAIDEERFITQKYEQRAVAERLVFAEEQVAKHAREKEALSKNAEDILKKSEEEWKGKMNDLFRKIESLEGEKQKEAELKQDLIQKISKDLDVLKDQENEWKTENSMLSLKVKTMEKKCENLSDISGKQKKDKEVQVVIVDEQLVNDENIAVKAKPPSPRPANSILCEQNRQVLRKSKSVQQTTPLNDINTRKPVAKNQNENENGEDNDHTTSQTIFSLLTDNQQLEDSSFLKETAKILKSCRKRSLLKRNESKLDDDVVFPANIDSEATETKRSRKDVKKRQRRVTFSDELEVKSFNTSKEQKEMEAVGREGKKDLVSHEDEPTPCNDLEPTNKASKVVSDVLSVKTRNGGKSGVRNLRSLGKQHSRQEHGLDSNDQVSLDVKGVKTSKGKKGSRKRSVSGNAPPYAVESVSQVHESNDNCSKENDKVKCGRKTRGKRGRKGNLPKIGDHASLGSESKEEQGNEYEVKTKRKKAVKGKLSPDYDILLSEVRQQEEEGAEQKVVGKEKGNKMKSRMEGKVHSVVDPTSLYQEELSNSENGRAGETGRCEGRKRPKRGLREQAFNSGGIRTSKRLVNMFSSESICQEGHCSGINTQHGEIKSTRKEPDATLNRAIDGKPKSAVNNETRDYAGGGNRVTMTRSRKGKRKVNEKTLNGTQTEDKIRECVETVKTGTDEQTVAQNGKFAKNEVSEKAKNCNGSEGAGEEIITRKRAAKRSMAEVNVGTVEKDEQEATETKERPKKKSNGKTNVVPKSYSKKKDTALRSEPKREDEETRVEDGEKRGKASTRSRKAKSEMLIIQDEAKDKCPQEANEILAVVGDSQFKKKDAGLRSEPKGEDDEMRGKAPTRSRKAKKEMVVSHDENEDKCPQEMSENEIKETVVQEKDERVAEDNHSKKIDAALNSEPKGQDEEARGQTTTRSRKTKSKMPVIHDKNKDKCPQEMNEITETVVQEKDETIAEDNHSKKEDAALNSEPKGQYEEARGQTTTRSRKTKSEMPVIHDKNKDKCPQEMNEDNHSRKKGAALNSEPKGQDEEARGQTTTRSRKTKSNMPVIHDDKDKCSQEMNEITETVVQEKDETIAVVEDSHGLLDDEAKFVDNDEEENKEIVTRRSKKRMVELNDGTDVEEKDNMRKISKKEKGRKAPSLAETQVGSNEAALESERKVEGEERIKETVEGREMNEWKGKEIKEVLPTDCDDVGDNDKEQENDQVKKANKSGRKKKMVEMDNEIKENDETGRKEVAKKTGEAEKWALRNNNEANKNKKECSQKILSELQNNVGTTNVVSGQQSTCTAVDPQAEVTVSKPVKKKRRTLYSTRDNSTMINTTNAIFQETLPLNHTRSSASMPPSLTTFMKAFIVPKLKK